MLNPIITTSMNVCIMNALMNDTFNLEKYFTNRHNSKEKKEICAKIIVTVKIMRKNELSKGRFIIVNFYMPNGLGQWLVCRPDNFATPLNVDLSPTAS